jgi:hypothetical protein
MKSITAPKATAFVTIAPFGIVGTASHFHYGGYFQVNGSRGNVWLFSIDEVMKLALTHRKKEFIDNANMVDRDLKSKVGLCVGFPLAVLINNISNEFGDDAVVALNRSGGNPDDRDRRG